MDRKKENLGNEEVGGLSGDAGRSKMKVLCLGKLLHMEESG